MPKLLRIISTFLFLLTPAIASHALQQPALAGQRPDATVTAAASIDRVRFTAPSSVAQVHLEVYSETAVRLFDFELKGGNVLDWHLQDGQAQRLGPGSYLCVVTVKNLSGKLSQKIGTLTVSDQKVRIEPARASELSTQHAQAVGPLEDDASLTVLNENDPVKGTLLAHTGTEGQIIRAEGALSFRLGDFYSGKDREQMRLTVEGNLGIGIRNPQVRLDVDGLVRASEGIIFPDGSIQFSAARKTVGAASIRGGQAGRKPDAGEEHFKPQAAGAGTAGRLAKWLDNTGNLGDSLFSESGTNVIHNGSSIQMTAAASNLVDTNLLFLNASNKTTGIIAGSTASFAASSGPYFAMRGNTYTAIAGQRGIFSMSAGSVTSPTGIEGSLLMLTGADQLRLIIKPDGNVGIGTTSPTARLDVAGGINTSTQYNISGLRVVSAPGSNTFVGKSAGDMNTGFFNVFFGQSAGFINDTGSRNNFFGESSGTFNSSGSDNSFFGDASGVSNTIECCNTFIGAHSDGAGAITNATAIGFRAKVAQSNSLVLGSIMGVNSATSDTKVGIGTTTPGAPLHIRGPAFDPPPSLPGSNNGLLLGLQGTSGYKWIQSYGGALALNPQGNNVGIGKNNPDDALDVSGIIRVSTLGTMGITALCHNASNQLSACSSSLRYKEGLAPLSLGLELINRLHPISFTWRDGGIRDIGLGAEEVERVEPLLVTYNAGGQVEGVKYDRLNVILINAIKELQKTITVLQNRNDDLNVRLTTIERRAKYETSGAGHASTSRRNGRRLR